MGTCVCMAESLHCSPETTTTLLISYSLTFWASLVAQSVKNLPAVQETRVQSLGWEDPLEKGMATHCSILVWGIPVDRGTWWAIAHVVTKRHN